MSTFDQIRENLELIGLSMNEVKAERDAWKAIVHECEELLYQGPGKAPCSFKANLNDLPARIGNLLDKLDGLKARAEKAEAGMFEPDIDPPVDRRRFLDRRKSPTKPNIFGRRRCTRRHQDQ